MKELHLFIIWERGRIAQDKILQHIEKHFTIVKMYDMLWTSDLVASNFSRFYGTNLPNHSAKEQECGTRRFLLVIVYDENPKYEKRFTSKGELEVNCNMFDAKTLYRRWTGGGHKIHATNSLEETNHDITLLLGKNVEDFQKTLCERSSNVIEFLDKDLEGATQWNSLQQLFYVLTNCVNYVILRGEEYLETDKKITNETGDIDIFTFDYVNTKFVINGTSTLSVHRPHELVTIEGQNYYLDLWNAYNNYYDPLWSENILASKQLSNGVYVLNDENKLYTLLYHGIVNKGYFKQEYIELINSLLSKLRIPILDKEDLLLSFLQEHHYEIVLPYDKSVGHIVSEKMYQYTNRFNGKLISYNYHKTENTLYYSKVFKTEKSYIKVATKENIINEIDCLELLVKYDFFPKIISSGERLGESYVEITKICGQCMDDYFHRLRHWTRSSLKHFILQCLNIFKILQQEGISHRDIKPDQFLIDRRGRVYLIDFGWAQNNKCNELIITPPRVCGERYNNGGSVSDVQMFGYVLKIWFKKMPYLRQVAEWMITDEIPLDRLIPQIDKYLCTKHYIAKDYYIILGKSYKKRLKQTHSQYLHLIQKLLRKIKRIVKLILK